MAGKKRLQQTTARPLDPAEQMRRMVEQAEWAQRLADALDRDHVAASNDTAKSA